MNREYNCKVSSKNSTRLLKNLQNTIGDYFFAAPCSVDDWSGGMSASCTALQLSVSQTADSFIIRCGTPINCHLPGCTAPLVTNLTNICKFAGSSGHGYDNLCRSIRLTCANFSSLLSNAASFPAAFCRQISNVRLFQSPGSDGASAAWLQPAPLSPSKRT